MPYQSSDKTRLKKDAKRVAMMQAAVRVFAEKGYYAATVRDVVQAAQVAIGTFYFYFPDKETLFVHLYEETAHFLVQTLQQSLNGRSPFPEQIMAGVQAYLKIAVYEPAVIHLLLVGGVGAVPALEAKRWEFREKLAQTWYVVLQNALTQGLLPPQNGRRTAEAIAGAMDEITLHLLHHANPDSQVSVTIQELAQFILRATGYQYPPVS